MGALGNGGMKSCGIDIDALKWTRLRELSLHAGNVMPTVNIHEAKTHLSRLVEEAAKGESFIIAKAGKPMVRVVGLDAPLATQQRRLGFAQGMIAVPSDFDQMHADEIAALFGATP